MGYHTLMAIERNPEYMKLSTQELKKARDEAQKALLNDPRTTICTDDPVYKRWSQLCWEMRCRRALA